MSDFRVPDLVPQLTEQQVWALRDATPVCKLYLLALLRAPDTEEASRISCVPRDEISVLNAWLVQRGYCSRFAAELEPLAA